MCVILFYPKPQLPKKIPSLISIGLSAIIFIIWDQLVTDLFWSFNKKYILGLFIGKLPVEEMLFFLTVPYACLLLWVNIKSIWKHEEKVKHNLYLSFLILCSTAGTVYFGLLGRWYTGIIFALVCPLILLDIILHTSLFHSVAYRKFVLVVIILTGIWNGYLTFRPIVIYYSTYKSGLQIGTIPAEDFLYGVLLISLVVIIYEFISNKTHINQTNT